MAKDNATGLPSDIWDALPQKLRKIWLQNVSYMVANTVPEGENLKQYFIVQAPTEASAYKTINIGTAEQPQYVHAPKTMAVADLREPMKTSAKATLDTAELTRPTELTFWTQMAAVYGLRHMDVVLIDPTTKDPKATIVSVNGSTDLTSLAYRPFVIDHNLTEGQLADLVTDLPSEVMATKPKISKPRNNFPVLTGDYPTKRWPLEMVTRVDGTRFTPIRMANLLAPIGPGSVAFMLAEGGVGKTKLIESYFASFAGLTVLDPSVHVVYISLGERQGDVTRALKQLKSVDYIPQNVEMYFCGATGRASWLNNMAILATTRAQRLAETGDKNVVVIFDSISRWERAASSATDSSKYLTGGIPPEVLDMIRTVAASGSNWEGSEWGSLTFVATMLGGQDQTTRGLPAEGALAFQMSDSGSTTLLRLMKLPGKIYPKLNVVETVTYSRNQELMLTERQLAEAQAVQTFMWGKPDTADFTDSERGGTTALKRLAKWAADYPLPPDLDGAPTEDWWNALPVVERVI